MGDARMAGFGSSACDARLVGEAGPDFVGEAGMTERALLPVDDGGRGTVWGPGR